MEQDEAWLQEGNALYGAGDFAAAETVLRRIGVSSYLCRDALLMLGRVLLASGRRDEALHCVQEAGGLSQDAHSQFHLGECLMAQGDRAGASAAFYDTLVRDPGHSGARFEIAQLLMRSGDKAGAVTQLRRLLDAEPDHSGAIAMLSRLEARETVVSPPPPPSDAATEPPNEAAASAPVQTGPSRTPTQPLSPVRPRTPGSGSGLLKNLQDKLRESLKDHPSTPG